MLPVRAMAYDHLVRSIPAHGAFIYFGPQCVCRASSSPVIHKCQAMLTHVRLVRECPVRVLGYELRSDCADLIRAAPYPPQRRLVGYEGRQQDIN